MWVKTLLGAAIVSFEQETSHSLFSTGLFQEKN
jgi:hypothetical protein